MSASGTGRVSGDASTWKGANVVSIEQFDRASLELVVKCAQDMKAMVEGDGPPCELLKGKVLANVFYEPSTRTACSFHAAMLRLGGSVISVSEAWSSAKKGETLEDTVRCLECYCDAIVLRHPETGSAGRAAAAVSVPLLNAGDGVGEHPTQALLDLVTILDERSSKKDVGKKFTVTLLGDLKHGRTVHSLARLLTRFASDLEAIYLVSPEGLEMPETVISAVKASGIYIESLQNPETAPTGGPHAESASTVLALSDVLYVTRIQAERFESPEDYAKVRSAFIINRDMISRASPDLVIMHPLPRVDEIATDVDDDPRAAYFRQMRNGLYTRMALLSLVLQ